MRLLKKVEKLPNSAKYGAKICTVGSHAEATKFKHILLGANMNSVHTIPLDNGTTEIIILWDSKPSVETIKANDLYLSGVIDALKFGHPGEIIFME
jgi:hypothetical protein